MDWRSRIDIPAGLAPRLARAGVEVADLFRQLAAGRQPDELLARHPDLGPEDLRACFALAAELLMAPLPTDLANSPAPPLATSEEMATLPPAPGPPADPANPTLGWSGDAESAESTTGRRIAIPGYEILEELGRGGMGVVYRARHLRLERIVALKMILAGEHASEDLLARFHREAQVVARMQHPGIVQIFEIGEHDGHSFLALEFVPGGSLAARLTTQPWPAAEAAQLVEQVARAVQVAHQHGIVHRDLKPENILLGSAGEPRLTDFGLAKQLESSDGRTRSGEVMGTPSYMAPEQAAGRKEIGPAADVHALGVLLHRLLSGRLPFEGPTTLDTLLHVLESEPTPLRHLVAKVPRDLETITLKCLHKDPGRRYASSEELADDLRRHLDGEPIRARQTSLPERAWRWGLHHPVRTVCWFLVLLLYGGVSLLSLVLGPSPAPAWGLAGVLLLVAFLRARVLPLTLGTLGGIVLLALIGWLATPTVDVSVPIPDESGGLPISDPPSWVLVGFLLAGYAALVGITVGALLTEQRRIFLVGLALFLVSALIGYPHYLEVPSRAALLAFYFGLAVRIIHYWCGGNRTDVLLGALLGTPLGYLVLTCMWGAVISGLIRISGIERSRYDLLLDWFVVPLLLGAFLGTFSGAYLGARLGRKGRQLPASPATGS
jgi:uncharacterized protein (DUF433 family)